MKQTLMAKAVSDFAQSHPDLEARVVVIDWTRAGHGGWKTKRRESVYWIANGRSAKLVSRLDPTAKSRNDVMTNGNCWVCGRVRLDAVIAYAHAPDPQAGEVLKIRADWSKIVRADEATTKACPECIDRHTLTAGWLGVWDRIDAMNDCERRHHPTLSAHQQPRREFLIDLRTNSGKPVIWDMTKEPSTPTVGVE